MQTGLQIVIGTATALVAVAVVLGFTFAFVVAPLIIGGGFVLIFLLYQVTRHNGRSGAGGR